MVSLVEWKAKVMIRLLELSERYKDNPEAIKAIERIMDKLHYLKTRDIASALLLIHYAAKIVPELLEILPDEETVKEWFKKGE